MVAIEITRTSPHGGWRARLAVAFHAALSAFLRPRPDVRVLSPHMRRDIGLDDSEVQRSGLSVSTSALPSVGLNIADTGRSSKSP